MVTFLYRSANQKRGKKILTSTPKTKTTSSSEADDVQLALGLSISTESLRRTSTGFISTQEYREDESRRSSLLRERESFLASKDFFDMETEVEEQEEVEQERVEVEVEAETESDLDDEDIRCFSQFRQTGPEECDETRRSRWCGDEKVEMRESTSRFVGQPVKPSVVVQATRQSVGDCSLRLVRSLNDGVSSFNKPSAPTIKACNDAKMKIGILKEPQFEQQLPLNLQYISSRKIEKDQLVVKLSDGVNQKEFLVSEKFAFMFEQEKIPNFSVLTILKIKKKDGHMVVKNLKVAPMGKKMSIIGDPK